MRLIENNLNVITFQLYECDLFFMTLDEVSNYVFIAHLNPLKEFPLFLIMFYLNSCKYDEIKI